MGGPQCWNDRLDRARFTERGAMSGFGTYPRNQHEGKSPELQLACTRHGSRTPCQRPEQWYATKRTFDSSLIDSAPSKRTLCADAQERPDRVPSAPDANLPSPSKLSTREARIRQVDRTVVHRPEHLTCSRPADADRRYGGDERLADASWHCLSIKHHLRGMYCYNRGTSRNRCRL